MDNFLIYILESTVCISVFYLLFRLLMSKETSFAVNRATLLAIVVASVIVPLVQLPQLLQTPVHVELIPEFSGNKVQIQNLPVTADVPSVEVQPSVLESTPAASKLTIPMKTVLRYFYLFGVLVALLIFIRNVFQIVLLSRKATVQQMDGYRLLIIDHEVPSFAFGRSVIISRSDYDAHGSAILAHEQAHIQLNHFFDLMLLELIKTIHWFNPAVYALNGDLKEIHEFQADQHTLNKGIDATQYQKLIIQKGVGSLRFALANSFNHCQIKKRITMMNKSKNSKAWRWKVATFLPLLALLLMAFGKPGENAQCQAKQWIESDFGKVDFTPTKGCWVLPIRLNSKSQLKVGNEITSWEEAAKQIRKYLDYNNTSEEMKPAFEKIIINGQNRMVQKYTSLLIGSDISITKKDYQDFLNSIGKVVSEIRQKYANEIYKTSYNNLSPSQRADIIRLIPAYAKFDKIPILATEAKEHRPCIFIEVRAEGIFVKPEKNVVTIDELKKKLELLAKKMAGWF